MMIEVPESFAPVTLHPGAMTDDEFFAFCEEHPDLVIESNAKGEIELMPPCAIETSDQNSDLNMQLRVWALNDGRGRALDCSGMFLLPNGARRSPDAAWISRDRIAKVPGSDRGRPWHACPEFVVELRPPSDRRSRLHTKMLEWIENGAELGWLIDPFSRSVTIYRPGAEPQTLTAPSTVKGEGPVEGFTLDLTDIWEALA